MRKTDLDNIAQQILTLLNREYKTLVSQNSMSSPRSVGDAVQDYLAEEGLQRVLTAEGIENIENNFTRRSMEDIAFTDGNGYYFAVDVKTHNQTTQFNMPNLISVQRLAKFYKNDKNTFCILIISYRVEEGKLNYTDCHFKPIEAFSWDCLTLGALGWGQIQIANANKLAFTDTTDRKTWMLHLCDRLDAFYDEEIGKIRERKTWFTDIRKYWEAK